MGDVIFVKFGDRVPADIRVLEARGFKVTGSLLHIATNEIASFCIDNRLCQIAFFVFAKVGKGQLLSYVEGF